MLGGYVSARIAKHDELLNGALSSILCDGGGTYAVISGSAADDLWMHLVFLPLSPAWGRSAATCGRGKLRVSLDQTWR